MRRCSRSACAGVAVALLLALLGACSRAETFAQHPAFARWFAAHPPSPVAAGPAERALLRAHRPVLFVPAGDAGPIDFYRDYIAHGTLHADGQSWRDVDRARLAAHADDPAAVFVHRPSPRAPRPVAYGRVDRAALAPFGELVFLTWHFVFRHSGLPAGLPGWQEALASVFGDPVDWHQLDHYTAATLVLGPERRPLGLILQQHNHVRSYWLGRDLALHPDRRPRIAAAVRSNELYPRPAQAARPRVVRFLEPGNLDWLAAGSGERPWTGAHDHVRPGERIDYALGFLPQTDPFYRFQGRLGAERLLPGRDGPPGADYKIWPAFLDRRLQLCAFRWPDNAAPAELDDLRALLADPGDEGARSRLFARCRGFLRERLGG